MADQTLQSLTSAGTLATADIFPIKQSASARLRQATLGSLRNFLQGGSRPTVSVTGTSKTFATSDIGTCQVCANASTQTLTIPADSILGGDSDAEIEVIQYGAGTVVFAAGAGVTINPSSTLKISGQYRAAVARRMAANEWLLLGSLMP